MIWQQAETEGDRGREVAELVPGCQWHAVVRFFFFKKNEQRRARWRFGHGYAKPSEINPDIDRPHLREDEDVDGG